MPNSLAFSFLMAVLLLAGTAARADDYTLVLKDHKFIPQELVVPANQKIKVIVKNENSTPSEFESAELNREKVVTANSSITVFLGPLDAGKYGFFDDFDRKTAGTLIAK